MADIGVIVALLLGTTVNGNGMSVTGDPWCTTAGALLMYFVVSSCLWTCCFAVCLLRIVQSDRSVEDYERFFHMVAWGGSAVVTAGLAAVVYLEDGSALYGPAGAWCWINTDHEVWRVSYVLVVLPMLFIIYVYVRIRLTLKDHAENRGTMVGPPAHQEHASQFDLEDSFDGHGDTGLGTLHGGRSSTGRGSTGEALLGYSPGDSILNSKL